MRRRSPGQIREHPEWAIAASIQPQERPGESARITAHRHPAGWFITASHPPGMTAEERADFRHFVSVRVYLLLRYGPVPGAWEREATPDGLTVTAVAGQPTWSAKTTMLST